MTKAEARGVIERIGIVPGIRVPEPDEALFAAEAVHRGGIPIAEITMTVPDAPGVIARLARAHPDMVVGAGTVLDEAMARRCLDAGARFLTSPGLVPEVVDFAVKNQVVVFPGALTPTDVIAAWKAGADFVKIFPADTLGPGYIKALRAPLPHLRIVPTGGVDVHNVADFLKAGCAALGVGSSLVSAKILQEADWAALTARATAFADAARQARSK